MAGNGTLRDIGNASVFGVTTARSGGDTYALNGKTLTIDQDTRYGLSGATTYSLGTITVSATLGGTINIDGRYVRLIPYNTGSGTITAGTLITVGSATAKVIGLYSAINTAPVLTGVATGWIKVTEWNGVAFPTSGTYTQAGFTFTVTGADKAGWIEVVGDEASTITANRLGAVNITGEWFEVGTTTGTTTSTYQLPTNGSVQYYPAVWVETGTATGVYEPYPCAGSLVAAASTATDAVRGKVCWATTAGVLRLGHDGTNVVGYCPPAGRNIRIPNILTANCTTAARATNALPNATLATRYDFTTTGGGVINIDKALLTWYPSFAQAYSVSLTDVGIAEQLSMSEIAAPMTLTRVAVGQCAAQAQYGLLMSLCFAGGTFDNCIWTSASLAASGRYTKSITDISDFTFNNEKDYSFVIRGNATTGAANITRAIDCTWNNLQMGLGQYLLTTCNGLTFNNTVYHDCITTTATANPMSVWACASNTLNCKFDGLTFGGLTNVQPYTAILSVNAAGCANIKLRNIGTSPSSQLSLGATNATGTVCALATGAAAQDIKLQRIFTSLTRTNLYSGDNSSTRITVENCMGDYADVPVNAMLNVLCRGVGATPTYAGQVSVYGSHWFDHFTSTTVGRIAVLMNETTSLTSSQVSLSGGAAFTSAGGLYMPTVGMTATFTMPYFSLGHTGFANSALVMAGGTATNYTYAYQIDTGSGFSAWSAELTATALGTALNGVGAINPATGVKLKLRITTGTTNATAITSVYVITSSSAAAQANYYPLDTNTLSLTGLIPGSDVVILTSGTNTVINDVDANSGDSYSWIYSGAQTVDVGVIKAGCVPLYIRNLSLTTTDSSLPIAQVVDRNYLP